MSGGRYLGALVVLTATIGASSAQDAKPPLDPKAFDKLVVDTLRDVHDKGADLYNTLKDYGGAYRLYEGSLRTVRPLLAHHPEVQQMIDNGLAAAEKEDSLAERAVTLHKTIEAVRAKLRAIQAEEKEPVTPPMSKKPDDKKPDDKKPTTPPLTKKPDDKKPTTPPVTKKPDDKKPDPGIAPMPKSKGVSGTVTYKGKPLATGTVTFVSLTQAKPKVVIADVKDGAFTVAESLPAGKYVVAVSSQKDDKELLPAKFTTMSASGLTVEVKAGSQSLDIALKD